MVVYTASARAEADGAEEMTAWIYLQVYETNYSYRRNNLAQQIRLVHRAEVPDTGIVNTRDNLMALTLQCDMKIDSIHQWRNEEKADVVVLITKSASSSTSGEAHTMHEYHVDDGSYEPFEACAFAVVDAGGFFTADYSFTHELGHVMGAEHNISPNGGTSAGAIPVSSHGYVDGTSSAGCKNWMTVMSQRGICSDCDRAPLWSDPGTTHCGEAAGSPTENNRDTLEFTAATVSSFRCGSPTPDNVWMKDTWEDTGAEPDTELTAEPMWKSPYIWVRTSLDEGPIFMQQHRHQNPVAGETNYIYAKVHNGGAETDGNLQFWVAKASTGLSWPSSFELKGSVPIADLAPNAERIEKLQWTPPDSGHYCLVAQWVSTSEPMKSVATTDVDANVRGNNNLVWHNVNVISIFAARMNKATYFVRNVEEGSARVSLQIKPSDPSPERSFLHFGDISLNLGRTLMAAWRRGGYRGTGFDRTRSGIRVTDPKGATLENLMLGPRAQAEVEIAFSRRDRRAKGTFLVDVIQSHTQRDKIRVVGGITYEIHLSNE